MGNTSMAMLPTKATGKTTVSVNKRCQAMCIPARESLRTNVHQTVAANKTISTSKRNRSAEAGWRKPRHKAPVSKS